MGQEQRVSYPTAQKSDYKIWPICLAPAILQGKRTTQTGIRLMLKNFRISEFQNFRVTELQGCRITRLQGSRVSGLHD
jgi:hypothetical protein